MQLEAPAVQGADNFSLLDPALPQRATGMRAAVRQGDNRRSGPEDRQAQAKDLAGSTPARRNLIGAAHQDPIGHDTWLARRQPGWKTASLGLASEASTTVDSMVARFTVELQARRGLLSFSRGERGEPRLRGRAGTAG